VCYSVRWWRLEVEVLKVLDVPKMMRGVLLCTLEEVGGGGVRDRGAGGDATRALYAGGRGG